MRRNSSTLLPLIGLLLSGLALCAAQPRPNIPTPLPAQPSSSAPESKPKDDSDWGDPGNYDEVVHDLIQQLLGDPKTARNDADAKNFKFKRDDTESAADREQRETVAAQDAARKLVALGKRSVPALGQLFRSSWDKPESIKGAVKASYYAAWALARIRNADAGRALLPALNSTNARAELRLIAVDAAGLEKSEEGVKALQKVALGDPDMTMRKKAFAQLTSIPEYWAKSEPIFVNALSDPDADIRTLAVKACHFSHIFLTANDKLVEMIEKDPVPAIRTFGMLTLGRLRYKPAMPALVRVLQSPDTDEKTRKVALSALSQVSEIPFTKVENALVWWKREGESKLAEAERKEKETQAQLKEFEESEKREAREALAKIRESNKAAAAPQGRIPGVTPMVPAADTNGPLLKIGENTPGRVTSPLKSIQEPQEYEPRKMDAPPKDRNKFDLLPDDASSPPPVKRPGTN